MVNSLASAESNRIIAAIDMGTNSFHMVVARIDAKLPAFTIIAREKDTVRLGDCEANTNSPKLGNSSPGRSNIIPSGYRCYFLCRKIPQ
jgi:hypothetical protein